MLSPSSAKKVSCPPFLLFYNSVVGVSCFSILLQQVAFYHFPNDPGSGRRTYFKQFDYIIYCNNAVRQGILQYSFFIAQFFSVPAAELVMDSTFGAENFPVSYFALMLGNMTLKAFLVVSIEGFSSMPLYAFIIFPIPVP